MVRSCRLPRVGYYSLVGTTAIPVKYTVHTLCAMQKIDYLFDACMYWYILQCTGVNVMTFLLKIYKTI